MGTAENKKEVWQYFFEKPKKNYNKYIEDKKPKYV